MNGFGKKLCAALLCCVLLVSCGDAELPPSANALEEAAVAGLRQASPDTLRLDTPATQDAQSHRAIRMTAALVEDIADLLARTSLTVTGMNSIGGNQLEQMMLQGQVGDQTLALELFGCGPQHYLYPDQTVLWLQWGDETSQYLAGRELFDELLALAEANLYEERVTFDREPVALQLSQGYGALVREQHYTLDGMHQFDNMLVACFNDRYNDSGLRLEGVLAADGKSLYSLPEPTAYAMEQLDGGWGQYDYALYTDIGLILRNSHNTDLRGEYLLLESITAAMDTAKSATGRPDYHVNLAGNQVAYTGADGVWIADNLGAAEPRLILPNAELPGVLGDRYPSESMSDQPAAYYNQPRVMGGGGYVAAVIYVPGSQSSNTGLVVHNLSTGQTKYYPDVFSAMVAQVDYPDDHTLAARGISGVTLITLPQAEEEFFPLTMESISTDYRRIIELSSERDAEGYPVHSLRVYDAQTPDDSIELLTARGDSFYLSAVTDDYAVGMLSDADGERLVLVPLVPVRE